MSALRFYDAECVLHPSAVDPASGYRRYDLRQVRAARLVAGLRRVAVPIAQIREAVEHYDDADLICGFLDEHLAQLEAGLADARREIDRLRKEFVETAAPVSARVAASKLDRLISAVQFAVGDDPEVPILRGVLLEVEPGLVRMVATDRYRLAVHEVAATVSGSGRAIISATDLAALASLVRRIGSVEREASAEQGTTAVVFSLDGNRLRVELPGHTLVFHSLVGDYPDYRRILVERPEVESSRSEDFLTVAEPASELATLRVASEAVVIRHEFLLEALAAAGAQASLRLDGPISPLVIRGADGAMSLLMPTSPEPAHAPTST